MKTRLIVVILWVFLWVLPWNLLGDPVAFGFPVLNGVTDIDLASQYSDLSTILLRDSSDPNIYYIPPKRIQLALDESTQKPLFKISYTQKDGAEFFGVFQLGFDPERVENSWSQLKTTNPNALLKTLPILDGTVGVELHYSKKAVLLGYADLVHTHFSQGEIPFFVKISSTGMDFIRQQLQTEIQAFLALRFQYKSRASVQLEKTIFQFTPREFFDRYLHHAALISEWKFSDSISEDSFRRYLMSEYEHSWRVIGGSGDFDINLRMTSRLFESALEKYILEAQGHDFSLKNRVDLLQMNFTQLPQESVLMEAGGKFQIIPIGGSAGVLLSGICRRYQDLVYQENNGEPGCLDFPLTDPPPPPGPNPEDPDQPWTPPF